MTFPCHNPHLFRWRRHEPAVKVSVYGGIIVRVEMASKCAVSEVFSRKKPHSGISSLAVPLQSSEQLRDHDDAYGEAQALLGDWLSTKLRLELEMEDEDDLMYSAEKMNSSAVTNAQPPALNYNNFDDFYNCLAEEEEQSAVNSFLQDLMEQEVLDSEMIEELALDAQQMRKKLRDPIITMEARHQQVRENRARREAERLRQQREREAQRGAREEAKRREQDEEMRKKQEERRQEEMLQQEMVRLRRQMEERRGLEQLVRQRYSIHSNRWLNTERLYEEKIRGKRHFSGWYSVVLDRRLRMGKALALCDWKRQLRAWRAWRAVVWAKQKQQEIARTEEALRTENRQCQLAVESDRRRLLRRCLSEWQLWCRMEKEQKELLAQQQETKRKMAALISAASTGKLKATETPNYQLNMAPPEAPNQPETTEKVRGELATPHVISSSDQPLVGSVARPSQPWQVTRRHAAPTSAQLRQAQQREDDSFTCSRSSASPGGRFENRHVAQQQIITQQRKLLKVQQEQIVRLKEEQNRMGLELELEKTAQLARRGGSRPKSRDLEPKEQSNCIFRHTVVMFKKKNKTHTHKTSLENNFQAEMKAAEEQRQREEEEEKRKEAEKRREEKRLEKERKEEKQRQMTRQKELLKLACQHYNRTLLLRRGLAPWKRLIQFRQANMELAESHHNLFLLSRCVLGWQQSARESLSEKEACADQLHQHFLLRRSLSCWKRLKDTRVIQEERAERFYRTRTLRRFLLALLDHVTQERLVDWDREELAQGHNNRRVLKRCFLAWRQLPCLLRKEREREARREKLGRKVTEVLPDFCSRPL
uniref:Coiled-coil domain containing 191 n=1 Tax=Acanthochromis polyacanthus TaxID=80966 RepID=A0A3Q1ECV2_9TELE